MRGLVITMATAGLFNSIGLDHAEGLLLAWMVALAYARGGFPQPQAGRAA
jgi:hypothetical protein